MFVKRLISGVILLAVTIALVVCGGNVLLFSLGAVSLIGQFELYRAMKLQNTVLAGIGYGAAAGYVLLLFFNRAEYQMIFLLLFLIVLMFYYVAAYPRYVIEQVAMVFFGFFYVAVMLLSIYQVRMSNTGLLAVWLIFIAAWGSDTCAYVVGVLFGKHKLPSALSPKKSIEGCIGGVLGAALIGFIYAVVFQDKIIGIGNPKLAFTLIGGIGSCIAQIGDLAASAIKRNHDIKDYGTLIPGHGGILDRFDSIIFTAPVVYFLIQVL